MLAEVRRFALIFVGIGIFSGLANFIMVSFLVLVLSNVSRILKAN